MNTKRTLLLIMAILAIVLAGLQRLAARPVGGKGGSPVHLPILFVGDELPDVLTTIALPPGSHPHGIALDPTNQRAFVANHGNSTLSILDTQAMVVSSTLALPGGVAPNGVAYHPGVGRVYVANRDSNNVTTIHADTGAFNGNLNVGQQPNGVVALGSYVYVANFGSDNVSVIFVWSHVVGGTISVGGQPAMLAADAGEGFAYVSAHGEDTLYVLRDYQVWNTRPDVPAPYGLTFDPIGHRLYAANRGPHHSLTLVDTSLNTIPAAIDVAQEPYVLAVNPRTGHIFVACGNVVRVYDRRSKAIITQIPIAGTADEGIAIDPTRNLVYVTSGDADLVTVIQDTNTFDLAFGSWKEMEGRLMIADLTGRHQAGLTDPTDRISSRPVWSPDGRTLLFTAHDPVDPGDAWEIWRMEPAGQAQENLTNDPVEDVMPTWSPDGRHIAWRRDFEIWVMDSDGANRSPLTPADMTASMPAWSPDGLWIAFTAFNGAHEDVYIIPATGGEPLNVSNSVYVDLAPVWSPDSREIAFESNRDGDFEIFKVNIEDPDNLVTTQLTANLANDHAPAWSADGGLIAFLSDRASAPLDFGVYLINADGGSFRRVSQLGGAQRPLSWSPDSRWLAVQSGLFDEAELFAVNVITGALRRLTNNDTWEEHPAWRPDTW